MITSQYILLFDGVCNLCNRLVIFIIKRDHGRKLKFVPLQSPMGQSLIKTHGLVADDIDSVVFISGANHFLKSSAVLNVLKEIGGGWKMFYWLIISPTFIRDYFYDVIARNRYRIFGKRNTCMVPTPDLASRFIL